MTKARILFRDLLVELYAFSLFHCLTAYVLTIVYGSSRYTFLTLALVIPFFLMFLIRLKIQNILLFTASHIPLAIWPLLVIPHGLTRYIILSVACITVIYSYVVKMKPRFSLNRGCVLILILISLAINLHLDRMFPDSGSLKASLIAWVFVSFISYLLFIQTDRLDISIDILSKTTKQPVRTMLRFNNGILAAFLGIAAVMAAFSPLLPINIFLEYIRNKLESFIDWLSSMSGESAVELIEEAATQEEGVSTLDMLEGMFGKNEPPAWLVFIQDLIYQILCVALVIAGIVFVIWVVYNIYKRFYSSKKTEGDIREFINTNIKLGAVGELWRGMRIRMPYFGKNESERIRRAYYKKVRTHIRKGVRVASADTAGEIAGKIQSGEDITALTGQYNNARYGK